MLKLNLGCGYRKKEDYINIDVKNVKNFLMKMNLKH